MDVQARFLGPHINHPNLCTKTSLWQLAIPYYYNQVSSSALAVGSLQGPGELTPFATPTHIPRMPYPKGSQYENAQF